MECVTRIVKLNGHKKNIRIYEPELLDVIKPDFDYATYVRKILAEADDNKYYEENKNEWNGYFYKQYQNDMRHLQQAFEDGLLEGEDINLLNEDITNKMKDLAMHYLEASDIMQSLHPDTSKRLLAGEISDEKPVKEKIFKKGDDSWKDTPIEEVALYGDQSLIFNEVMKLPNIPEDYHKYTINELIKMNEEYIKSEKGRNR